MSDIVTPAATAQSASAGAVNNAITHIGGYWYRMSRAFEGDFGAMSNPELVNLLTMQRVWPGTIPNTILIQFIDGLTVWYHCPLPDFERLLHDLSVEL